MNVLVNLIHSRPCILYILFLDLGNIHKCIFFSSKAKITISFYASLLYCVNISPRVLCIHFIETRTHSSSLFCSSKRANLEIAGNIITIIGPLRSTLFVFLIFKACVSRSVC